MLLLTKSIINQPVMSLRTGSQVALADKAIIDPNTLKIEGFYCNDSVEKNKRLVLVYRDIRDVLPAGLVVDDHSVLSEPADLIRLRSVMELDFELVGKVVVTTNKRKIGRVNDYAVEPKSMMIKKLYVGQSIIKNFAGGSLSVDRNQIVEINNRRIIIKEPLQPLKTGSQNKAPIFEAA
jgi:sporulation protein YlmC with PRC-barrel domain